METIKICPNCRKPLPPDVPLGLCPECLIKAGFPTGTEPGVSGEAAGARFVPPPVAEIAQLFPQLEILGFIGKGGMGAVYKARQPALDRFVALKVLPPAVASDPGFAERFNREARALARLNHPNIVAVHDFGKAGTLHYLLMEFVDGTNLREVERAGKLSPEQALTIVPQICEALQFAHNEGIVHRDIKPENLLLDKKGRVKITDFGIAKIVGVPAGKVSLTGVKDVVGTPHYMAPEQIEKPQTVDHRADIYSLGVVFYEMLTGELPLGKFQPPSKKVQIDVRLDEVVLHALEKEPERRYQQASEIKTRVETIAQTPLVAGVAPNIAAFTQTALARDYQLNIGCCLSRGWNLVAHNFWPIVGVAALIGLLQNAANSSLIGIVVGGPLSGGLWLYFLKKIRGEPVNVGTAFNGFTVAFVPLFLGGLVTLLLILAGFICFLLPGIYLAVAWAFTLMLIADQGLDFWPAMNLSRKVVSKHWWKFLWFFIVLGAIELAGLVACLIGLFVAAPIAMAALAYAYEDIFGPAARAAGNVPAGASVAPSRSGGGWGTAVGIAAGAAAAVVFVAFLGLLAAVAIPNFVRARQHSQQAAVRQWTQQGWQLWQAQEMDKAAAKFRQAVELDPDNANAWNGLGWATFNSGKKEEAEQAFQKAISLDTNQPGALNGLGQIYLSQRKYNQAETYLLKAAPQASAAWFGLARLYLLEGKFDQARDWAQKLMDYGQSDEVARQMLSAAREKSLGEGLRLMIEPHTTNTPAVTTDQVMVEHLALRMLAAIRDKDDAALKEIATERVKGWRESLPQFAFEMREKFHELTGKPFDMHVSESLVRNDTALVKCAGPAELNGKYLVLFFVKTDGNWKNCFLHNSPPSTPLEDFWKQMPPAEPPATNVSVLPADETSQPVSTNLEVSSVGENPAISAAQKWLALIDAGSYSESWENASAIFQGGVTEPAWENSMNTFRKPLGALVSRKLKSAEHMTEMPGAPDGQYVLMQFETSFANKKSAIETVTFMLEKDGQWKSAGYFIK